MNYNKNFKYFLNQLENTPLKSWREILPGQIEKGLSPQRYGDLPGWVEIVENLPEINPSVIDLNSPAITIGDKNDCSPEIRKNLEDGLKKLHPWRKGPYSIFDIFIDTEWRSDMKWDRLSDHISPLEDRHVLDIGCGNGYHCWRMAGAGAELVVGIDPSPRFIMQFQAVQKYIKNETVVVLPLRSENMPENLPFFDTVFSMGVLYHRRSPMDHLRELFSLLRDEGELVLETLVIDGGLNQVLVPEERYGKMNNVWFIPSGPTLEIWLKKCGFKNIRLIDITKTTPEEQRRTDWMTFESLADFLDPENDHLTVEGHPAPKRAIFIAEK